MNPFLIGIPGFFVGCLLCYVFAEISAKYLNVEQTGTLALQVRPIRIRFLLTFGAAIALFLLLRLISLKLVELIFPWVMLAMIVYSGWFYWRTWKVAEALGTPPAHRRLFAASSLAAFFAIALLAGACASTAFVPKSWIQSKSTHEVRRMEAAGFWKIVDRVHDKAGEDLEERSTLLRLELDKLSVDEIAAFQHQYDAQIARAHRWDLWGAAYVMNGGCSDDGFRYFRDWLISEGSRTYEAALLSPESLADLPKGEYAENEEFGYVALAAFEAKGGGEIERDMSGESGDPQGTQWEEQDLPRLFPRLSKKYS